MKNIIKISLLMGLAALFIAGCQTNPTLPEQAYDTSINQTYSLGQKIDNYPLRDSRMNNVGTITVSNDANFIYVTYMINNGWLMEESDLHITKDVSRTPGYNAVLPVPLDFDYRTNHNPAVKTFTYRVALNSHRLAIGDDVLIQAHAKVLKPNTNGESTMRESVWGVSDDRSGDRWRSYIRYTVMRAGSGRDGDVVVDRKTPGSNLEY